MTRKDEIFQKLDYADHLHNELGCHIFSAESEGRQVKFIQDRAGDILVACREVFDYCANDIIDIFVSPHDQSIASRVNSGKIRPSFPFNLNMLMNKSKGLFVNLREFNLPLHNYLCLIVSSVERKMGRPETLFNYGHLRDMCIMVNMKKRKNIISVKTGSVGSIYAEGDGIKIVFPLADQRGISRVTVSPGLKHVLGNQYVSASNKMDIMKFRMFCKGLSRLVMQDIYGRYIL